MKKNLVLLLVILLLVSCEKDEGLDLKKILSEQSWKQLSGVVDGVNYDQFKHFYKVKFNEDYTCEIIIDFGRYELPDLDTLYTKYSLEGDVIEFTESVDTLYLGETMTETFVYLNSWRIVRLDSTRMDVESVDDYQPPIEDPTLVICIEDYFFESFEN